MSIPMCQHCEERAANRPRGLCTLCYYKPSVRNLYDSRIELGHGQSGAGRVPASPTQAPPGSIEKIAVMRERVKRGEMPHHPGDTRTWADSECTPIGTREQAKNGPRKYDSILKKYEQEEEEV